MDLFTRHFMAGELLLASFVGMIGMARAAASCRSCWMEPAPGTCRPAWRRTDTTCCPFGKKPGSGES